jgi:hypothetical protein
MATPPKPVEYVAANREEGVVLKEHTITRSETQAWRRFRAPVPSGTSLGQLDRLETEGSD